MDIAIVPNEYSKVIELSMCNKTCSSCFLCFFFFFPTDFFTLDPQKLIVRQLPAASSGPQRQAAGPIGSVPCSTTSSGGPSQAPGRKGCCQGPPNAVLATACWTATDSMLHHRRVQPAAAAARTAGGARWALTRTSWRTKLCLQLETCLSHGGNNIHYILLADILCLGEWTLARHGHDPSNDGRRARHHHMHRPESL